MKGTMITRGARWTPGMIAALFTIASVSGCAPAREKIQLRVASGGGVAVMTFEDRTGRGEPALGSQVAHQFASRLALGTGNVMEPHQLEALFAERGMDIPMEQTTDAFTSIRDVTRCDVLVLGSVNSFSEGEDGVPPKAAVSIRLIDLTSGFSIYSRGKFLPERATNLQHREAGYLVLDCADYLADRMSVDIAFIEEESE